jgi:hypothetical protein
LYRRNVMFELFFAMVKEEWRLHSTIFGNLSFALFPVLIFWIALMGSFLLPLFREALPAGNLSIVIHSTFLMLGFMVGAFGLLGTEVMNRRFGQASLLSYSARSLPLSERVIFATFVIKDTVYYFFLWVFPFGLGFAVASPFIGLPPVVPALLLITLTLSFLYGLCVIFFLSTVYSRSKMALAFLLLVLAAGSAGFIFFTGTNPARFFPPLMLFTAFSWGMLVVSSVVILVLFIASLLLFSPDISGTSKHYQNRLSPLVRRFSFFPTPPLTAKDLIDLSRSGSLIGQTLFSFLIPLVVIWFFLSVLEGYFPPHGLLLMFACITGVIASTMYTWLTMFDTFGAYACLPVSVRTLLMSKITSFSMLQIIPAVFIVATALFSGEGLYLFPALLLCLSISFFSLGITVWLTGLSPNVLVYDVKVMVTYLVLSGLAVTVMSGLAFADPLYSLAGLILLLPAWWFMQRGMTRWESREQSGF